MVFAQSILYLIQGSEQGAVLVGVHPIGSSGLDDVRKIVGLNGVVPFVNEVQDNEIGDCFLPGVQDALSTDEEILFFQ